MRLSKEREEEIRFGHGCLVPKPDAKHGVVCHEHSFCDCAVKELLAEIDALRDERDKWKEEYFDVSKFATDYEQQRDALKEENATLTATLRNRTQILDKHRARVEKLREALINISEEPNRLGLVSDEIIKEYPCMLAWYFAVNAIASDDEAAK